MTRPLRVLALEPYYGGSHRSVLDLLVSRVEAEWTLLTLPPRKWKWRMRGAAITMAEQAVAYARDAADPVPWDVVFASTFVNLAEWKGLVGPDVARIPAVVYFHENQLLYPNRHTAEWDVQFPLTNITSALAADACVFNTRWNLDGFLREIPPFLRLFPDHRPGGLAERIAERSHVLAPPFDPEPFEAASPSRSARCRIIWPHRWEHDKNPMEFVDAVRVLAEDGADFEVAVAGQAFRETEALVREASSVLGERLVHCGEPADRGAYARLLATSDVAVSTASNEFFGLAMIEACHAGCYPLVPDRLAYPELYPEPHRYHDASDLVSKLRALIADRPAPGLARGLAAPFTIDRLASDYEKLFRGIVHE